MLLTKTISKKCFINSKNPSPIPCANLQAHWLMFYLICKQFRNIAKMYQFLWLSIFLKICCLNHYLIILINNKSISVWITTNDDIVFKRCKKLWLESFCLTGGNWQKWKRVFLTCPCHEIYRDEAVGLKGCKNTWKITIFVKMWNLGQYRENLIFCQ